jgi:REP element-mobilizing transposase RayT
MAHTIRFTRRKLPHWEVEQGRYFVTVRCADSLPHDAILHLAELQRTLSSIPPRSPEFAALQRQVFHSLEKYLDAGIGSCPLRDTTAASLVVSEFESISTEWKIAVPHFTIMPNHWHALFEPSADCVHSLSEIMKRLKGRTAKHLRRQLGGRGSLWQREWFDRWIRDDTEWERCVAYIRNNPVKAGLAAEWTQHPWTK